jgi:hypothetical protein
MSMQALTWASTAALSGRGISAATRMVLVVLADYADPDGRSAYPSVPTIADRLDMSERAVRDSLVKLEEAGMIREGDQRLVAHIRHDRRPLVRDLSMAVVALPEHGVNFPSSRENEAPEHDLRNSAPRANEGPEPVDNSPRPAEFRRHDLRNSAPNPKTEPKSVTQVGSRGDPSAREIASMAVPRDPGPPAHTVNLPPVDPLPGQGVLPLTDPHTCTGCFVPSTDRPWPLVDGLCPRCYLTASRSAHRERTPP